MIYYDPEGERPRRITVLLGREPLVPLFGDRELDSAALGQADVGLRTLADHEDVTQTGSKSVAIGVLKLVVTSLMKINLV